MNESVGIAYTDDDRSKVETHLLVGGITMPRITRHTFNLLMSSYVEAVIQRKVEGEKLEGDWNTANKRMLEIEQLLWGYIEEGEKVIEKIQNVLDGIEGIEYKKAKAMNESLRKREES